MLTILGVFAVLMILVAGIFLLIWFVLAPNNLFWTFVKEGTAEIVVKGDAFEKAIIQWEGYTFDYEWNVIEENDEQREPWHLFGGLRWYGFWPIKDIYIYRFKWSGVDEEGKVIKHPAEVLDYTLLKDDVYYAKVDQAEDQDLLPLNIELNLTIRIKNPYKSLFKVQNWLETTINQIKPTVRDITGEGKYKNWIQSQEGMGAKIQSELEMEGLLSKLDTLYGVEVLKIQVKDINPPEDYRKQTLAPYFAEMGKEAKIIDAEGEAKRIEKIFSQIQAFGDMGKLIRSLEAMEKSPLAASLTVQAIPGLQEIFRGVFGKPSEAATTKDIQELKEMIARIEVAKKE